MSESILAFDEDGKARLYNSEFDVTIHCEDEQQMNEAVELLNLANRLYWRKTAEEPPTEADADKNGCVLSVNNNPGDGFVTNWTWELVRMFPDKFTIWMPTPKLPEEGF